MNAFPSTSPLAINPTLAVLGFRKQLIYHLHFWAFIAVGPLVLVQWQHQHYLLSGFLILFCLNALLVILFLRFRNTYFFKGRLFPLLAIASAAYSTSINGHAGLYWVYPAATALFFLLPLKEAVASSTVFVVIMAVVSFIKFPEADFWRITFSLALTCLFAMIFAWLVGKLQQELARLAKTDVLTGCLNRSQMADTLNNQIRLRERYKQTSSLILLNLDDFRAINNQSGHLAGDNVIGAVALRVRKQLRANDYLLRTGGEEFMIVLAETHQKDAEVLAMKLLTSISSRPFSGEIAVTASASVAELYQGETWSVWLNRAEQTLYEAKSRGRNQMVSAPCPASVSHYSTGEIADPMIR
ncbi:MAG TPA: GGDEF domain-containing protein [Marinobacter sp.]|nr:GGDEF domain-containing protein [Marinobacter sp.]